MTEDTNKSQDPAAAKEVSPDADVQEVLDVEQALAELEERVTKIQRLYTEITGEIVGMLQPGSQIPAINKGMYESVVNLEVSYMWVIQCVNAFQQLASTEDVVKKAIKSDKVIQMPGTKNA